MITAESIIEYAATHKIEITQGGICNSDDNTMCAAYVVIHMYIGNDAVGFDMWFDKWDKRIPFSKKQIRALEVGFENYEWEFHLYEIDPFDSKPISKDKKVLNEMFNIGQRVRFLLASPSGAML
jgi:hypothetical protein